MKKILIFLLAVLLTLGGCAAPGTAQSSKTGEYRAELKQQSIAPLDERFTAAVNGFGFEAAKRLYTNEDNLALSPASIELALCMTRSGAAGETAGEMAQVLGLQSLSDSEIINACKSLMWRANTGGMEAANAIWLSDVYTFSDPFVNTCTNDFFSDAFPLVIPGAMDAINAWADEKTHGRIQQIVNEELSASTRIVLANALYYLGEWELPFEANDTFDDEFFTPSGSVTAPFMHSDWSVPYYQSNDFSMITLNFKSKDGEGKYAMAFLLPAEGTNVSDLLGSLDAGMFSAALSGAEQQVVWIKLPKFEFAHFTKLKETLAAMGMTKALSPIDADFSAMTDEANQIYIDEVLHKCYIRVDELGAEAAAVTEVAAEDGAMEQEPPKFYADRPFVFAIYSQEDGTIAFIGAVNDPTKG